MKCLNIITFRRNGKIENVPCGKCIACCSKKSSEWQFRLQQELKLNQFKAVFLTLTYEEENLTFVDNKPALNKHDLQLFFRYLRRTGLPVRYFAVGEYGGIFQRPHYHIILFGITKTLENYEKIKKSWKHGFITLSDVTAGRICYATKYMFKFLRANEPPIKEFMLVSKRPGLGYGYIESTDVQDWHISGLRDFAQIENGIKLSLPRYLREKIFSPEQLIVIRHNHEQYDTERGREEYDRANSAGKDSLEYIQYIKKDIYEFEYQQQVIDRLKYKEQLKKERYEHFQKLKTKTTS